MSTKTLQEKVAREGWQRYHASLPAGATKPSQAKPAAKDAIGPLEAEALRQIAAAKRVQRADRTSARGIHKLPRLVIGG